MLRVDELKLGNGSVLQDSGGVGIKMTTNGGYIEFGPKNTSYAHIYTDRPKFYFNRDLMVSGNQVYHQGFKPTAADVGAMTKAQGDGYYLGKTAKAADAALLNGRSDYFSPAHKPTWDEIDGKPTTFAPASHNHDDRYYTESESNSRYFYGAGSSGSVAVDEIPWGNRSGVYQGSMSGASNMVIHFKGSGSCPAAQFRVGYANGGLWYKSARDSFGFEKSWERIYTSSHKPTPVDIGAVPISDVAAGSSVINKIPKIRGDGVMEIGKYIDFHDTDSTKDYDVRFSVAGSDITVEAANFTSSSKITAVTGVDARGMEASQGLQYYGKTAVGGTNDSWLRLNPHNQFESGIYCYSSVLRTDGYMTVGEYSKAVKSVRIKKPANGAWGVDRDAAIDVGGAPTTGSSATYMLRYTDASNARVFAIDVLDQTGETRIWVGKSNKMIMLTTNGDVYAQGNVTAYSDIRIKDDIQVIDNALEKVKAIRGVTFTRKDSENGFRQAGVIAQEVEKVLPEVIQTASTEEISDLKTVAYGNMVALLIEAVKELSAQVEDLKQQCAA
ncbi:hypothetical protein C9I92_21815 [Photobacterium ganghwense]|uniref:tail fiber domain-containing protein n=1 Tax=Photobacterium ganghwense TaxID=320778 RepID=UPI00069F6C9B|nr:tail fiber domain-containing protein [Photobacterium ganghwense]PSU05426.1 hypothetical protein C9I92_21815 [Photobacterium ganghwense]